MADPSLTPARLALIQQLFEAAVDETAEGRAAIVAEGAKGDPALHAEVLALLAAHDTAEERFVSPVSPTDLPSLDFAEERWTGVRLGAYVLGRRIGTGGMGTVYEAVRADDQYEQRVAIKLLRRGVEGESAMRRLRTERQILAHLNHPNIARLLDGGATAEGQPYLVMEYVEGTPIDEWADQRRLSVRDRVELLVQVCAVVQYAHQNLVIHRDLKPANILVTADGVVKLLDFGIAKLLPDADGFSGEIAPTRVGFRVLTPEYAAPEQFVEGTVGTATDVYALGVLLFELLTGRRPLELADRSLREVELAVIEQAPPRPSTVLGPERWRSLGERNSQKARERVAGDLDAIALMALRKEAERRYGTAEQLSQDLQRFLTGRPVLARPDGVAYRVRKFVRRRSVEVATASVAVASLLGGLVATSAQTRRAESEHQRMLEVTDFLTTMLGAADPASFGRDVTVREVLDSAAVRASSLQDIPALEADIRAIIGGTYIALGEYEAGESQYRLGLAAQRRLAPDSDHATAMALARVAAALEYSGRFEEADSVLREASRIIELHPARDPISRADFLDSRGRVLARLGRAAEAQPLLAEALRINRIHRPLNDSVVSYAYANLAMATSEVGDNVGADTLYQAAVTTAQRAYGEEHPLVAAVMSAQATVFDRLGDWERADSTLRTVTEMRRRMLGAEHPEYAWTVFNHADHLVGGGFYPEAAEKAREVLALRGRSLPDTHPAIGVAMQVLGRALAGVDSLDAGEYWLRESLELRRRTLPEGSWLLFSSESVLGEHLARSGRFEEAEELLLPAERALVELRGERAQVVQDVRERLVALYAAWNRPADSAKWQRRITAE